MTASLDAQLSFDDLRRRSNFLAAELRSLGVVRGDRVLLMLGNVPALVGADTSLA